MKIAIAASLLTLCLPAVALAGPCSDDIAAIGKQLSQSSALGPVTSGTLSGSVTPGHTEATSTAGTSADAHVGGTAGTKELNAASANVATSDADVRQQQAGKPVAAAPGQTGASAETDRTSRAKADWQRAVDLNAQNDAGCKGAVDRARAELKG